MKTYNRYGIIFLLIATQISLLCAQSISTSYPRVKSKIDPLLQQAIVQKEKMPARPLTQATSIESYKAGTRLSAVSGDVVAVLIKCDDDINKYTNSIDGIRIGSRHGNIYTALVPLQSVAKLAQLTAVKYIEASRRLYSSLDLSRPKTGADVLQELPDLTKRLTGKGVIIGFTDSGINTDHPNFKLPDGRTRILYVWDQNATSGGVPPAEFSYGIEKDSSAINAHAWSMADSNDHGTHVSGIAAGNGRYSMYYIGMAPEADIIMVANKDDDLWNHGSTTAGTLDGFDYIRTKANALHKRFVINTSQGTNLGPHDGTTLFEQALNADVAAGGIHCVSAGNEAIKSRHASAVVSASSPQEIHCELIKNGYDLPMDIWYEANDRMVLRIKEMDDTSYVSLFPPVDSTITYSLSSADVTVTTKIGSPLNGDNEIFITIHPTKQGVCYLRLQFSAYNGNTLPDGGRVDLWLERYPFAGFTTNVDWSITLGMPACADSAITVASYNNRTGYGLVDDISNFSSRGPRRDGVMKPEIAGIGGMVISSVGSGGYETFSGTSMSSPHVAGAIALLLQQDSTLKNYQIRNKLLTTATADGFTGSVPNPVWGYGKLNVLKAAGYYGIPIIAASKDTILFADPLPNIKTDDSVIIKNLGSEDLTISNVSVSDPIFSVDKTSFTVLPHSQEKLIVSVTPASVGSFQGLVTITCNDTARPTSIITVAGHSDYRPAVAAVPDSFAVEIVQNDSTERTVTIRNNGTGNLRWSVNSAYEGGLNGVQDSAGLLNRQLISKKYNTWNKSFSHDIDLDVTRTSEEAVKKYFNPEWTQKGKGDVVVLDSEEEPEDNCYWDVAKYLIASGRFNSVSGIDGYLFTPTLSNLQNWNVVIVFGWDEWGDNSAIGDLLADYVDAGGNVLIALAANSINGRRIIGGRFNSDNYWLITPNPEDAGGVYHMGKVLCPWHSIMSGIRTVRTFGKLINNAKVAPFATCLANFTDGTPLVAVDESRPGRRVDISYPVYTRSVYSIGIDTSSDADELIVNAVEWLSAVQWLTFTPESGMVTSGNKQDVLIKFNSLGLQPGVYRSNIIITSNDSTESVKSIPVYFTVETDPGTIIPDEFALRQNYPNPFNPATTISYELPEASNVQLKIFDILGREVVTLVDEMQPADSYHLRWTAEGMASGIYFAVIRAGDFRKTVKMILMK
jgi:subtilisin family serine protease